jgi:hypothetical protein
MKHKHSLRNIVLRKHKNLLFLTIYKIDSKMLFDNGIFWLVIIILTVIAAVLFGVYNRQDPPQGESKDKVLLILGWVFLGIDLLIFGFALIQALDLKKSARKIGLDAKQI